VFHSLGNAMMLAAMLLDVSTSHCCEIQRQH